MSTITIELADEDVIFIDDISPNIKIKRSLIPFDDVKIDDVVDVYYDEDSDTDIKHRYIVTNVDDEFIKLEWQKQFNESMLVEGPVKNLFKKPTEKDQLKKAIQKDNKKLDKQNEKIRDKAIKLLKRDVGSEGREWKFYLQNPDGSYGDPIDQAAAKKIYSSKGTSPSVLNAIVVTKYGFIVRRGMEDTHGKGVKFTPENMKLKQGYSVPVKQAKKQTQQTEADPVEEQPVEKYSAKLLDKLTKVATATGMRITDLQGKEVKLNTVELTPETINQYVVAIKGVNPAPLSDWLDKAVSANIITENCDVEEVMKNKSLLESPVIKFNDDEINNPNSVSLRNVVDRATAEEDARKEAERFEKETAELREKAQPVIEQLDKMLHSTQPIENVLEMLHDKLVPEQGKSETVAGELVRAMMRLLYRDYNDGDKFFQSYGLETCASSASYLAANGFEKQIDNILDDAYRLADDDDKYTESLMSLTKDVVHHIKENTELLWTPNEEDSRDYDIDYIEEKQPRYEYSIYASEDVETLVDRGVLNAWDLNKYVESQLEWTREYEGAEVSRPWTHTSTEVTIENLTKDGYDLIHDSYIRDPDGFWADLVAEYADELADSDEDEYDDEYDG